MKKILIILGAFFLVILLLMAVGVGVAAVKGSALDRQSKAYVDSTVPNLVSGWNEQELLTRASPELIQQIDTASLNKFYGVFRRLGRLREYRGSEGQSNMALSPGERRITAMYIAKADFDSGAAVIEVTLIKLGDEWRVQGFNVNSDVFLKQ